MDITINDTNFLLLKELHRVQKETAANSDYLYSKGLYDGMEAFMSLIEDRSPEYSKIEQDGVDMCEH
jgi:hypothetical protein